MTPRIVLDTNIHVAAMVYEKSNAEARRAARVALDVAGDDFQPVLTRETYRELGQIVLRKRYDDKIPRSARRTYLRDHRNEADYIRLAERSDLPACDDPKDIPFLAAAAQRDAKYLVTLDYKHLGSLGRVNNTLILDPAQFLLLEGHGEKLGLKDEKPRVVVTDHKPLLVRGHVGNTVFLTPAQAELLPKGKFEVEEPALLPMYNPANGALKNGGPEGWLMVTDNPDLSDARLFGKVTFLDSARYSQLKSLLTLERASDAPRAKEPVLVTHRVHKFTAGVRRP